MSRVTTASSAGSGRGADIASAAGRIGVVVIGRDIGERLERCLRSVLGRGVPVIYADSGSSDRSAERAGSLGADVVALDDSASHTAARGRNAGFQRLEQVLGAAPEFVQFVDGDTEVDPGWMSAAAATLEEDRSLAVVCGVLRERDRDRSVYARLLDMEWRGPFGRIDACGGIFMIRSAAFKQIDGFQVGHAAGEEPDLCARLRRAGWTIARIDAPMGVHDAGMTRFGQWWTRSARAGWSYAKAAAPGSAERSNRGRARLWMTALWAVGLPLGAAAATAVRPWPAGVVAWSVVAAMNAAQVLRVWRHRCASGDAPGEALLYSVFCQLAKWPEFFGQLRYWRGK